MPVKTFADTSSVAIAYAVNDAANNKELGSSVALHFVPFTTEGFSLSKDSQTSTAISSDRRVSGSKNTQGSASGSVTMELGYNDFIKDMMSLAMMGAWQDNGDGGKAITDGDTPNFAYFEKRVRNTVGGKKTNFVRRFYGNLVNEATLEINGADLATFAVTTTAAFADLAEGEATDSKPNAGGAGKSYSSPKDYEIVDGSNNVEGIKLLDEDGNQVEATFQNVTVTITNNVETQDGVGYEFAAGLRMGKVNVSVTGDIYYYDETILKAHLQNKFVSIEIPIKTREGEYIIKVPAAKAEAPDDTAQGENQDYTQSLTLNGERGTTQINGKDVSCVIAIFAKDTGAKPPASGSGSSGSGTK